MAGLIKGILSYGLLEGLSKGLNKLVILLLPFFLITSAFGKIGLILAIELLVPVVLLLGLDRAVLRFQSDQEFNEKLVSTVKFVISILHFFCLLTLSFLYIIDYEQILGLDLFPDLLLLLILIYFQALVIINLNRLRVESRHKEYFRYRLVFQTIKILTILFLAFVLENHISYIIGGILSSLIIIIWMRFSSSINDKLRFDQNTFVILIGYSWPFVFHGLAGNVLGSLDRFIIKSHLTLIDVGQYTLAYSIGSAVTFSYVGLSVYIEPLIYKEKDKIKREKLLSHYVLYALLIGVLVAICSIILSNYIIPNYYGDDYIDSLKYIPLIAIAHLFLPFYTISNYRLAYEKKTKSIAFISIVCSILNVLLNLWLIPIIGVYGSVVATLVAYFLMALLFTFKIIDIKSLYRSNIIFISFLGLLSILAFYYIDMIIWLLLIFLFLLFTYYRIHLLINKFKV